MKSSWVWMMVLDALGCGLIWAEPKVDIQQLSGTWYPLATAQTHPLAKPVAEYRIDPKDQGSFAMILPIDSNGKCMEKSYLVTAEDGGFKIPGDKKIIRFVDTDYKNYHIITQGEGPKMVLILYARKKYLSLTMKARFFNQALKWGFKTKHMDYQPKIYPCQV